MIVAGAALASVLVAAPTAVGAGSCDAPAGTAAIEQFCEAIPGPDRARGLGDRVGAGAPIAPGPAQRLERSRDGRSVLQRLIDRDTRRDGIQAPFTRGESRTGDRQPSRATRAADAEEPSSDPLAAVGSALGRTGVVVGLGALALLGLLIVLTASRNRSAPAQGAPGWSR